MSPSAVGRPRRPPYAYVRARKGAIVRCEKSLQSAQVDVFDVGVVVDVIAGAAWGDTERWEVRDARGRRGWVSAKVMAGVVAPSPPLPVADVDATAVDVVSTIAPANCQPASQLPIGQVQAQVVITWLVAVVAVC